MYLKTAHLLKEITGLRKAMVCYSRFFSTVQNDFSKLGGGSVDLTKDKQTGIATLILNNPDRKNSLTGKMMVDFADCVKELERWEAGKAVILAGAGNSFCSGGELKSVDAILNKGREMCDYMQDATSRLFNLPLVSVAAISGHAVGGGAELTTACDFRIMRKTAKVGFIHARLNVTTGWGGGSRLVKLIGRTKALHLLTSGVVMDAEQALKIGYADGIVDSEGDIVDLGKNWLQRNVISNMTCTRIVKQVVLAADNLSESGAYNLERDLFATVFGTPAHVEALNKASKFKK